MKFIPEPAPSILSELRAFVSFSAVSSSSTNAPSGMKKKKISPAVLTGSPRLLADDAVRGLVNDDRHDYRDPAVDYRDVGVDSREEEVRERVMVRT